MSIKMKQIDKILALTVLSVITAFSASAKGSVSVTADLDSVNLLMGNRTAIHLKVVEPESSAGLLLLQPETAMTPEIEIAGISAGDTTSLGNGMREILRDVIIQSFDSGDYVIPAIKYLSGKDTILSNELAVRVTPVDVSSMETINPQAEIENGESKWFDFLPDFLLDYWKWILFGIVTIAVAITLYLILKKKKLPAILRKETPKPSPYEVAISDLNALKNEDLCSVGREKEYYTRLTDILRIYLQDRFGINAMEMTTGQIIKSVYFNEETRPSEAIMSSILKMADFVKFAKARPLPEDNIMAINNAMKFVEETKPKPVVEEGKEVDPDSNRKVNVPDNGNKKP